MPCLYFYLTIFFLFFLFYLFIFFISKKHRYTCVPHPEPSSLLPPHTIPLGRPSALVPSIQYRASNLDWQLISYMIFYMFQCHSPKSSHPLPLPEFIRLFYTSVSLYRETHIHSGQHTLYNFIHEEIVKMSTKNANRK